MTSCPACASTVEPGASTCPSCGSAIEPTLVYAPLWRRLAAAVVDGMVLFLPARLAGWASGRAGLATVVWLGYFVVLTALWGQTVGKYLTGVEVVRTDGSRPDFATAALREVLGKFVAGLVLGLGYVWAVWDERSQGLHDKLAGTVVVDARRRPPEAIAPLVLGDRVEAWTAGTEIREAIRATVGRAVRTGVDAIASALDAERPDLRPHAAPDGTLTILFADVQDAAELTERLGDRASRDALRAFDAAVRESAAAHEGYVVKSTGDGVMLTFRSARRAVRCALHVSRSLREWSAAHPDMPLRASVGVHCGEVVREGGDYYGRNVVLAARIADEARGGEILVSSLVRDLVGDGDEFAFGEGRVVALKDLSSPHVVHAVLS